MSSKGSNKGIYLFWGTIVLVIVIVLLVVFLPRAQGAAAHTNMVNISVQLNKTDKNNHTVNFFAEKFIQDIDTQTNFKTSLQNYHKLWNSLTLSDDFSINALLYVSPAKGYNSLVKKQNQSFKQANAMLKDFQAYCTNNVTKFFDGTPFHNRKFSINETLEVFLKKYTVVLNELIEFYEYTAQIVHGHATQGIEINPKMLEKHLKHITSIKTSISNAVVSSQEVTNIYNNALIIYADGYYKSLI